LTIDDHRAKEFAAVVSQTTVDASMMKRVERYDAMVLAGRRESAFLP
jgi:hypothetical protein